MRERLAPDLVLHGGTVHALDEGGTRGSAVAVKDGHVVGVGGDELRDLAGPGTRVEALDGATVLPGLVDAHLHLLSTGRVLGEVQLYGCRSIGEIVDAVAQRVAEAAPGAWVVGRGWDESLLAERRHPTRHDLDRVSPDTPVVLDRVWNKLVCNSAALRACGLSRDTPDPPPGNYTGSFERDADGEPTGLFRDRAKELVLEHVPRSDEAADVRAIEAACRAFAEVGLTAVGEPGLWPHEIGAFSRAHREGKLTVRTDMMVAGWGFGSAANDEGIEATLRALGLQGGFGDRVLRLEGVKLMVDGGVGDATARMLEPYPGGDSRGQWIVPPDVLPERIAFCHSLGFPVDCHACGDETQQAVARAYAAAQEADPRPHLRHRIHHAYLPTPEALALMARDRIPAVVSSPFLRHLGESYVISLGEERAARMMPMRTYLDAGVPLAGSSDSPITTFSPWQGMLAATTRETVAGRVLGAGERLTMAEALRSYTLGGAYATGREGWLGSLEPGKAADLVVLDRDPLALDDPHGLAEVQVRATLMAGAWAHDAR